MSDEQGIAEATETDGDALGTPGGEITGTMEATVVEVKEPVIPTPEAPSVITTTARPLTPEQALNAVRE